ncbi:hypothetical protein SAMN05443637_12385 [Pseudonocardia thermophila]|uniref:Uncharacterized protein n=1 Tax=Pseudonocardia thermophila TaxID=1848 RepID=A0A1M6ZF44_PSETH|nr:hypothetical protein [Pseudonocardia thermophila]SHL28994.1 hypothetical protein SAMN05443637_12385 [Pseudonocardia thermophila]
MLARFDVVGVAAAGHPLTAGPVTPESFAAANHLGVSRRGRVRGPVDDRLAELGSPGGSSPPSPATPRP